MSIKKRLKIIREMSFMLLLFLGGGLWAQSNVSGVVTSKEDGETLVGVSIVIKGTDQGVSTDIDGKYNIEAEKGQTLVFTFVGKKTKEVVIKRNIHNVALASDAEVLGSVSVVGSRFAPRSAMSTASAIDIIPAKELTSNAVQTDITDVLTSLIPSFQSNRQSISDVADYSDPATLRGLGQDHTLVLVNGKRYHPNALINILGGNPGQVATDLNSLPSAAINQVEVLRDGASAQYGSDAIAGVMNLKLAETTDRLKVNLFLGAYPEGKSNQEQIEFQPGAKINSDGSIDGISYTRTLDDGNPVPDIGDGQTVKFDANYGVAIKNDAGEKTGFANFTISYAHRGRTNRTGNYSGKVLYDDNAKDEAFIAKYGGRERFNLSLGNSKMQNSGVFFNLQNKISGYKNTSFYAFGGLNFRKGENTGFYRRPFEEGKVNRSLYPLGFLPGVHADMIDQTLTTGIKSQLGKWDLDVSYTYGKSAYDLIVRNSLNRSMGDITKFQFDVGGYEFTQHVAGLYLSRSFDFLENFNLATGVEYRVDRYALRSGEEASYKDYTLLDTANATTGIVDGQKKTNSVWTGAAQVYPGHRPESEVDENRSNVALYIDGELEITDKWMVSAAGRYENYSDFGNVLTGKLASVYRVITPLSIRASVSTGFRAPSLQQIHHSTVTNNFDSKGVPHREGTFSNTSSVARLIGIDKLQEEKSLSWGVGTMFRMGQFSLTLDYYWIKISDRIINTGNFEKSENPANSSEVLINTILDSYGAERANFFANALDMESQGLEAVASYKIPINAASNFDLSLAYSYVKNEVTDVKYPDLIKGNSSKESIFYTKRARTLAENVVPNHKAVFNLKYSLGDFSVLLRNQYYGSMVVNQDNSGFEADEDPFEAGAQIVNDLLVSYQILKGTTLSLGANNIFDQKPDAIPADKTLDNRFPYFAIQQGFMGRYLFVKLNLDLGT